MARLCAVREAAAAGADRGVEKERVERQGGDGAMDKDKIDQLLPVLWSNYDQWVREEVAILQHREVLDDPVFDEILDEACRMDDERGFLMDLSYVQEMKAFYRQAILTLCERRGRLDDGKH